MSVNGSSDGTSAGKVSIKNLTKWDIGQTVKWLRRAGFGDCERYFVEHKINGRALLMLDEDDLKEVVRDNVGQRKNLYHLIKTMQVRYRNYVHSSSFEDEHQDKEKNNGENETESERGSNADDEADDDKDQASDIGNDADRARNGDDGGTSDDDDQRLLKNRSFIRNKVKLGSGLGLRNRGLSTDLSLWRPPIKRSYLSIQQQNASRSSPSIEPVPVGE